MIFVIGLILLNHTFYATGADYLDINDGEMIRAIRNEAKKSFYRKT